MRVGLVTLGCDKNVVDNEYLAGMLSERGHEIEVADPETPPDVVVITTCGFLDVARQQSIEEIERWTDIRRDRGTNDLRVGVIGCLAQRVGDELKKQNQAIDFIAGVAQFERVIAMLEGSDCPAGMYSVGDPKVEITRQLPRKSLEGTFHSYLKISDGCNHGCSFCSIPLMKGKHRSVPRPILLEEARRMIASGVREINIVAQDSAMYGWDTEGDLTLADLLEDLCAIEGDFWVRLFYLYPTTISERLIEVIASQPKIVKYLDMPLQHLDEDVLQGMRRPHDGKRTLGLLRRLREAIPGLTLRTTFIIGFPGETERAFKTLLEGVESIRFERMGAFCYSPEPGTPAADLHNRPSEKKVARRFDRLMRLQSEISADWTASQIGTTRRVLIESETSEENLWVGRSYSEAPDVDGIVGVYANNPLAVGQFVDTQIVEADTYDLTGEVLEPESELIVSPQASDA